MIHKSHIMEQSEFDGIQVNFCSMCGAGGYSDELKVQCVPKKKENECVSCGEEIPKNDCEKSKRPCGHHCDCSWSQDHCCWCNKWLGEDGKLFDTIEEAKVAKPNDTHYQLYIIVEIKGQKGSPQKARLVS